MNWQQACELPYYGGSDLGACWAPEQTVFKLRCRVYGTDEATCRLFEDDGVTYDYETGDFNIVTLEAVDGKVRVARTGDCPLRRYEVAGCEFVD